MLSSLIVLLMALGATVAANTYCSISTCSANTNTLCKYSVSKCLFNNITCDFMASTEVLCLSACLYLNWDLYFFLRLRFGVRLVLRHTPTSSVVSAADITTILATSNQYRSNVALGKVAGQPAATNMRQLVMNKWLLIAYLGGLVFIDIIPHYSD